MRAAISECSTTSVTSIKAGRNELQSAHPGALRATQCQASLAAVLEVKSRFPRVARRATGSYLFVPALF
jgi:hypothetical protein